MCTFGLTLPPHKQKRTVTSPSITGKKVVGGTHGSFQSLILTLHLLKQSMNLRAHYSVACPYQIGLLPPVSSRLTNTVGLTILLNVVNVFHKCSLKNGIILPFFWYLNAFAFQNEFSVLISFHLHLIKV